MKRTGWNCKTTLNIEFEQDWSVGLGATLRDRQKIKKNIILVTRIFQGKADSAILLSFECSINTQNLMKIVGGHFWENENFSFFFLRELLLILRVDRKRKNELEIFARGPYMSNLNEIGQLV